MVWPGDGSPLPENALSEVEAVINLAGESIAEGRWTEAKKARLRQSRLGPTNALVKAITSGSHKPALVLQTSAIGYYPDIGDGKQTESNAPGADFLAQLCIDWEDATKPLSELGIRVALMRIGVVMAHGGGALPKLAKLYHLGLGAAPGDGQQWLSWIHIDDVVGLFMAALRDQRFQGPVNVTAPEPVRFVDLHRLLTGRREGPVLKAPAFAMKLAMGESAQMALASTRVIPAAALAMRFEFKFSILTDAVDDLLGTGSLRDTLWLRSAQWLPAPLLEVAKYFSDASNLQELTPPWLDFRILSISTPEVESGTLIKYKLRLHGVPIKWTTEIVDWQPPFGFVDQQLRGPFSVWHHTHKFSELGQGTLMIDLVRFKSPVGKLGALVGGWMVERDVSRIFAFRRETIAHRFPSLKS